MSRVVPHLVDEPRGGEGEYGDLCVVVVDEEVPGDEGVGEELGEVKTPRKR